MRNDIQRIAWWFEDTSNQVKEKIGSWNDCPQCGGDGCVNTDICYETCSYCQGKGKISVAKLWEWHWYESIQPTIHKVCARIAPKLWQAYQNKLDAEYKKIWEEELRKENSR